MVFNIFKNVEESLSPSYIIIYSFLQYCMKVEGNKNEASARVRKYDSKSEIMISDVCSKVCMTF